MEWGGENNGIVGIIGGMGSYATLDFFDRILGAFPSEKDWDKPRMIIDNYASLPSRVRAILYNENADELIEKLSESYERLLKAGAMYIVSVCHTSHYFFPQIIQKFGGEDKFLNLIALGEQQCKRKKIGKVRLMASEGTIRSGIYLKRLKKAGIEVMDPDEAQLKKIRSFIECVKQNRTSGDDIVSFSHFLNEGEFPVILGCSELPVLYRLCCENDINIKNEVIDPLQSAIELIVSKYKQTAMKQI